MLVCVMWYLKNVYPHLNIQKLLLFLLTHYPIPPAVPLLLHAMARPKESCRPCQPRVINALMIPPALRMAAKGHIPRCIDHLHKLLDKSENGSNRQWVKHLVRQVS